MKLSIFNSRFCAFIGSIFTLLFVFSCVDDTPRVFFDPVEQMYIENSKHELLFDSSWKFYKGDVKEAAEADFDDSGWIDLDLPHDWSIEDLKIDPGDLKDIDPKPVGPFSPNSPGDISTGFVLGGTGWYRKSFSIEPQDFGKIMYIHFDGVYMNSDVWINGHHLGNHPYGYTAFSYDISRWLNPPGQANVISVRVRNKGRNSRWYSGSGIYRHVWLKMLNPLHVDRWGVYVSTPEVNSEKALVKVQAELVNLYDHTKNFTLSTSLIDPNGKVVARMKNTGIVESGQGLTETQSFNLDYPSLWSIEDPVLYLAYLEVEINGKIVDIYTSTFGIRSIDFSSDKGFELNGKAVLIKGGNMHHDNGPLGSAAIDRAEYRRVELMKEFGYNAIRTSHNPPSRQFLDACDKLGVLVMDESFDQWKKPKNPNDYNLYFDNWWEKDIESMVLRDRNHPSIIVWSIGNEIKERADSSGLAITKILATKIKAMDSSRPVTAAICGFWDNPGKEWPETAAAFELLDVGAYNYKWQEYESDHTKFPDRIILGTESVPKEAYENWTLVEKYPWVLGDFLWTSMDYLGEAGIGNALLDNEKKAWPWFNANCGDIDLCGFKKPQSYYRDVLWDISPIEMAVHTPIPDNRKEIVSFWGWPNEVQSWNWSGFEEHPMKVSVYSIYEEVSIMLNGMEKARKKISDSDKLSAFFTIPFKEGELLAIGYKDGIPADTASLRTTGIPYQIRLTADRDTIVASRNDLCYIKVEILDEEGIKVPDAMIPVEFIIEGKVEMAGVGNGNPKDIKSFQSDQCITFRGQCLVIIRPNGSGDGNFNVTAKSKGLLDGKQKGMIK